MHAIKGAGRSSLDLAERGLQVLQALAFQPKHFGWKYQETVLNILSRL
jgi:hypothetical protein